MATLVYGLNQSLDGFVDHDKFGPDETLFAWFINQVGSTTGSLYGRRMYEIMSYWDTDQDEWGDAEKAYAQVWRAQPKWVASRTLTEVGPNATLLTGDLETAVRELKDSHEGVIEVAGPHLAAELTQLGLIDQYQIVLHPVVVGEGTPFFVGTRPSLRLQGIEQVGDNNVVLTYIPA